jgi:hypothetical protein
VITSGGWLVAVALEAMRRPPNQSPLMTMKNAHPVELLLVAVLVTLEAAAVLLTALVALVLTVARWSPAAPAPEAPPPLAHPLTVLADSLQALPQRELMALAGTRRRLPKRQLAALLVAC